MTQVLQRNLQIICTFLVFFNYTSGYLKLCQFFWGVSPLCLSVYNSNSSPFYYWYHEAVPRISFYYCLICRRQIMLGMNFTIPPSTYLPLVRPHIQIYIYHPLLYPLPPSFPLISPLPLEFKESGMFYCLAWDPEHSSTNFFYTFLHEKASSSNVSQIPIKMCIFSSFCSSICKVHY